MTKLLLFVLKKQPNAPTGNRGNGHTKNPMRLAHERKCVPMGPWTPLLLGFALVCGAVSTASASEAVVTVMTRNMDAGTDLNYVLAATDQTSLFDGLARTYAAVIGSKIPERAARIADEIATERPDLIALQEVTLWRTGLLLQPPATTVLYDQLQLLLDELQKRGMHYSVVISQELFDKELPVPTAGIDLRITDRDVILARTGTAAQMEVLGFEAHLYQVLLPIGSPLLGSFTVPRGWMSMDVRVNRTVFKFVDTHLENVFPQVPQTVLIQEAQASELIAALATSNVSVIIAGDFNANADSVGPERYPTPGLFVQAGYVEAWHEVQRSAPGYTWPLFGEDQLTGASVQANERIDLIFVRGGSVLNAKQTGLAAPFGSDHAGVIARVAIKSDPLEGK